MGFSGIKVMYRLDSDETAAVSACRGGVRMTVIRAWLLDYRPLDRATADAASAAAGTLPAHLARTVPEAAGARPEWAVLATCHRCEVYACGAGADSLRRLLDGHLPAAARGAVTAIDGVRAAHHLMQVAAGLDSLLIGETDVQRQVVEALDRAMRLGSAGPVLNALFRAAVHAGKRARTVTAIGRHATSLAPAAVDLIEARFGPLHRAQALVFGAGTMARRACERLRALGVGALAVTNRTGSRAQDVARTYGGRAVPWEEAAGALRGADIAIAATAAQEPFIDRPMLDAATAGRGGRTLHLVDLALPRNVRVDEAPLDRLRYYDFADLEEAAAAGRAARAAEVPHAKAVIEQELARFRTWLEHHEVTPALRLLGERAAAARDAELERAWRRLPELTARQRRVVESLAHNLTQRLLRLPRQRLRHAAGSDQAARCRAALEYLFAEPDPADDGATPDAAI